MVIKDHDAHVVRGQDLEALLPPFPRQGFESGTIFSGKIWASHFLKRGVLRPQSAKWEFWAINSSETDEGWGIEKSNPGILSTRIRKQWAEWELASSRGHRLELKECIVS